MYTISMYTNSLKYFLKILIIFRNTSLFSTHVSFMRVYFTPKESYIFGRKEKFGNKLFYISSFKKPYTA